MARYASDTKVEFPELQAIRDELKARFSPSVRAKFLGAALKAATDPTAKDLKTNTKAAFGKVTGNLYRSVTSVVKRYPKTGNAVGLVGYRKSGTSKLMFSRGNVRRGADYAYHAGLLIFGTKSRRTKRKGIASSYNSRGSFSIKKKAKRGKYAGSTRVRTTPKYPKAFFKKGEKGRGVNLGKIHGNDVLMRTFNQNKGEIRSKLAEQMTDVVERATRFLQVRFPPKANR